MKAEFLYLAFGLLLLELRLLLLLLLLLLLGRLLAKVHHLLWGWRWGIEMYSIRQNKATWLDFR